MEATQAEMELIKLLKPVYDGSLLLYKRALIHGEMIHSKLYQKVSQRNSYTIEFSSESYGEVLYFIELNEDDIIPSYFAVVNRFSQKECQELTKDRTTGPGCGSHLVLFERQRYFFNKLNLPYS